MTLAIYITLQFILICTLVCIQRFPSHYILTLEIDWLGSHRKTEALYNYVPNPPSSTDGGGSTDQCQYVGGKLTALSTYLLCIIIEQISYVTTTTSNVHLHILASTVEATSRVFTSVPSVTYRTLLFKVTKSGCITENCTLSCLIFFFLSELIIHNKIHNAMMKMINNTAPPIPPPIAAASSPSRMTSTTYKTFYESL